MKMYKSDNRIDELQQKIETIEQKLTALEDNRELESRVAYALQRVLDANQAICIKHYIDGKEVTTKLLRDELRDLEHKRSELERLLKEINELAEGFGPLERVK